VWDWSAFWVAVPLVLAAVANLVAVLRQGRKLEALHVAVNSRLTELLASTEAAALARGKLTGPDVVGDE